MPPPPIICRRVAIAFDPTRAGTWHSSQKDIENFLNGLSFSFPAGERFFVDSVMHYRDRVSDPALAEEIRRFAYQEGMHSKEHARCNEALRLAWPLGTRVERIANFLVAANRRCFSHAWQLASTCAMEHLTAVICDALLNNQDSFLQRSDPAFASLWLWHAVEETEHKAVAFDVYQAVFGRGIISYLRRVGVMALISVYFLTFMAVAAAVMSRGRGGAGSGGLGTLKDLVSTRLYFDYYRRDFHPWGHDNSALVEKWKRRYQDFGTEMPARMSA